MTAQIRPTGLAIGNFTHSLQVSFVLMFFYSLHNVTKIYFNKVTRSIVLSI